jgi:hypothetical protein
MKLTRSETWILLYGGYPTTETDVDKLDKTKAIEAEKKAYSELCFNQSLLEPLGYRERRLDYGAHESLREKLKNET